jgi:hypothetical protein
MSEHAVIVSFRYGLADLDPLFELERRIERALAERDAGELDGNEVAHDLSEGSIYIYGPDADAIYAAIEGDLAATPFLRGAQVTRRYGSVFDPSARQVESML